MVVLEYMNYYNFISSQRRIYNSQIHKCKVSLLVFISSCIKTPGNIVNRRKITQNRDLKILTSMIKPGGGGGHARLIHTDEIDVKGNAMLGL